MEGKKKVETPQQDELDQDVVEEKIEAQAPRVEETVMVPIGDLEPNEWNSYKMSREKFDRLVEEIEAEGFDKALLVVCHPEKKGKYRIVDGEKRWAAARVAGLQEIPCVVKKDWSVDKQKIETHTRNEIVNDEFDKPKFTLLANDLMQKKEISEQQLREAMAINTEKRWNKMYLTKKSTEELEEELKTKEAEKEMKFVDSLSVIVNELIKEYGKTIPYNFLFFMLGKNVHLMVTVKNDKLKKKLDLIRETAIAEGRDINDVFLENLK